METRSAPKDHSRCRITSFVVHASEECRTVRAVIPVPLHSLQRTAGISSGYLHGFFHTWQRKYGSKRVSRSNVIQPPKRTKPAVAPVGGFLLIREKKSTNRRKSLCAVPI